MNKDKILYVLLVIKTFLAFVLSYNLVAKGDCGSLVNALGNFIIGGNVFIGLFVFGILTVINLILVGIAFSLLPKGLQRRLLLQSSLLDLILLFVGFYYGTVLWMGSYMMPFEDAISKISILITGLGFLLYFINFAITLPYCIISTRRK